MEKSCQYILRQFLLLSKLISEAYWYCFGFGLFLCKSFICSLNSNSFHNYVLRYASVGLPYILRL